MKLPLNQPTISIDLSNDPSMTNLVQEVLKSFCPGNIANYVKEVKLSPTTKKLLIALDENKMTKEVFVNSPMPVKVIKSFT